MIPVIKAKTIVYIIIRFLLTNIIKNTFKNLNYYFQVEPNHHVHRDENSISNYLKVFYLPRTLVLELYLLPVYNF